MLSTDLDSYLMISELVSRSQHFREDIVIAAADEDRCTIVSPLRKRPILCYRSMGSMPHLSLQPGDLIGISARSTGKVNVQTLMEALGGGGHFTNAATQIKNSSIGDVENQLRAELTKMNNNKE